jgi:hypothetical protein
VGISVGRDGLEPSVHYPLPYLAWRAYKGTVPLRYNAGRVHPTWPADYLHGMTLMDTPNHLLMYAIHIIDVAVKVNMLNSINSKNVYLK